MNNGFWHSIPSIIRILFCIAASIPIIIFIGAMLYILPHVVVQGFFMIIAILVFALKGK